MSLYAPMRKSPDATPILRQPVRRSAAPRPIPVLDVHHPLERDAQVAVARSFDAPRPTSSADSSPGAVDEHELRRAPGIALSSSMRELFERRMGRSFCGVRVHVGREASSLAERMQARAFTHGRDIYFARGEFRPETREGRGLIAHELVHTLQPQARGGTPAIARFPAPGAATPVINEEAKTCRSRHGSFRKYAEFLRYDVYLAAGYPIATGVIEGACRYVVKDRMGITGARWSLAGGEAVLRLRAIKASGDFDEYWAFHRARELERNHHALYANGQVPATATASRERRKALLRLVP